MATGFEIHPTRVSTKVQCFRDQYPLKEDIQEPAEEPTWNVMSDKEQDKWRNKNPTPSEIEMRQGEDGIYEVERILDHKYHKKEKSYDFLVRWRGYDHTEDNWLSEEDLESAADAVQDYKIEHELY